MEPAGSRHVSEWASCVLVTCNPIMLPFWQPSKQVAIPGWVFAGSAHSVVMGLSTFHAAAQARFGHLRFVGWKTVDVTEKLFRTQPILDWLAYSAEYADGRVFAADTVTTGVIGCMTEVAKKRTERPCE